MFQDLNLAFIHPDPKCGRFIVKNEKNIGEDALNIQPANTEHPY